MNRATMNGHYRQLVRALRLAGAQCVPVYRIPKDENGVATDAAQKVGCLYGTKYERGQTANMLVDIPGVVARVDAPRLLCLWNEKVVPLQVGDLLCVGGSWYEVITSGLQMGLVLDVVMKESREPDGV